MSSRLLSSLLGVLSLGSFGVADAANVRIELFHGGELTPYVKEVAHVCNVVYREPPYLYDGTSEEYDAFLASYAQLEDAIVCVAFDGDMVVGAATGRPMAANRLIYQQPFIDQCVDLETLFYHGELVLLPEYRGQGYGTKLYRALEKAVVKTGCYSTICLCQIVADDGTVEHEDFWEHLGFTRRPDLVFNIDWRNVGDTTDSPHLLTYWTKSLAP